MESYKILILGAGAGGISTAARLPKTLGSDEIAIIEPSATHFYQPLWTLVGAGLVAKEQTAKPQKDVIPKGVKWIQDSVLRVDANASTVQLTSGKSIGYEYLIVATGLKLSWNKIQGLEGNLGKNGICSVYQYDQVDETTKQLRDLEKGTALLLVTDELGKNRAEKVSYNVLHLVPPMEAHSYVAESGLASEEREHKGWLKVDKGTLQHLDYRNIFGVGDVTGVPNSKTGAAVRSQYPVVAQNILDVMSGRKPSAKYNGYSSCPLTTEIGKVMLAEFGYDGKLLPSFPLLNPATPRRSMWFLKKHLLPILYWKGMLKGQA